MTNSRTGYATIGMVLDELQSAISVSELHGGLCGSMCAGGAKAASGWLDACVQDSDCGQTAAESVRNVLDDLELETWRVLASSDLDFVPLLPEDDAPLDERVAEVASWCQGFLAGLALGGLRDVGFDARDAVSDGPNPVEEIVDDFSSISRAGLSAEERHDPDDADFALAEIVEYIRVGVQIVFEEIGSARAEQSRIPTSMSEH
ncbi:MAG TPA: UPF0149 family protein [Gammaproteobacteria bacterium]